MARTVVPSETNPARFPSILLACALAASACGSASTPSRPNVLFISIDTLRADQLGTYGCERATSPRIDAFATGAVVFEDVTASAPWTLPAMASLFTSTYTTTNGCWGYGSRLDDSFTTLTELLLAHGYDTACVVSHLFCTTRHGLQQGFVHFDDTFAYPKVDPDRARTADVIADGGIDFLERKAAVDDGRPWLLWLHFFDPHSDYMEAPGFTEHFLDPTHDALQHQLDLYDGEIAATDHEVGRVLDALEEAGLAEETIVVLVADHGEEFLEHGGTGHGATLFSEVTRIPMILRAPGIAPTRITAQVRSIDLLPTLLDLLELPTPSQAAGATLVPLFTGEPSGMRRTALIETRMSPLARLEGVREGRWKLVRPLGGAPMLYDLSEDPGETTDVAGEHPEEVLRLTETLETLLEEAHTRAEDFEHAPEEALPPSIQEQFSGLGYVGEDP
ncbi:MAG TPA: hypothetical protein ENJ09_03320 [Planctomycetes bacterium]|nr:hypothetical protein [Planctomycetota bacterium]